MNWQDRIPDEVGSIEANDDRFTANSYAVGIGWAPNAAHRLTRIARVVGEGRAIRGADQLTPAEAEDLVACFEGRPA